VKRAFLLTLATFFLTGCFEAEPEVVIGREFPLERVPAIKRHVTSKKSVEDIMGPPYRKETLPGRQTKWRYYMRKEQATYVLWVFPSSIHITETRMEIVFDGSIVESLEKSSSNFSE
jgi:hypothetical protein